MRLKIKLALDLEILGANLVLESDQDISDTDFQNGKLSNIDNLCFSGRSNDLDLNIGAVLKGLMDKFESTYPIESVKDIIIPSFIDNIILKDLYIHVVTNTSTQDNYSSINFIAQFEISNIESRFVFQYSEKGIVFGILFNLDNKNWSKLTDGKKLQDIEIGDIGLIFTTKTDQYRLPILFKDNDVTKISLGEEIDLPNDINFLFRAKGKELNIDLLKSDKFIDKVISEKRIGNKFTVENDKIPKKSLSVSNGMYKHPFDKNWKLGPTNITKLYIILGFNNSSSGSGNIVLGAAIDLKASLSVLKIFIEEFGFTISIDKNSTKPYDFGFKPPTGVALSIDTEGIKGGGFLTINTATGEYRGGLVLGFRDKFTFRAVAIINTKLPGGEPGFSLFVMITAGFQPVQLGFGFTLNAVGGLFGYNRTVEVDKLNELVRSGKASQLLFPPADADLPTIVNTAAEVYPVRVGNFVFGPMAKIGWGTPTIVMAEIALIIEVPDPVRVGMLGVIRVVLPDAGNPLPTIRLNMAFFAVVDFAKKMFSLQASLFDSKLLSVTLSGDFAVYMSWGQQRMFIFSAGGFHPAYKEAPPQLASMRRLNLTLIDDKKLTIAATTYLAITSNTVQFGSHIVLWCKFGNAQINGQFWFDVLFQFKPFRFQAEMGLTASLRVDKHELAAIRIVGRLNGPGPWYVWGEAYIKVWFYEKKVEVEHSWGEEPPVLAPEVVDVKQMLLGEVQKKENWITVPVPGSAISGISVRDLSKMPEIVLMPNCLLTFRQKVVPLGIEIQKFGEALPQPGENKFEVTGQIAKYDGAVEIHPANELFARANYLVLNDEEKLSYPSFEEFKGGITLGLGNNSAVQLGAEEAYNYDEYEVKYLGQEKATKLPAFKQMFLQELKGSAAYRSPLSLEQNRPGREAIAPIIPAGGEYVIMRKADLTALGESGSGDKRFKNFTEAEQYLKDLKIPQFADRYSIVSTLEL